MFLLNFEFKNLTGFNDSEISYTRQRFRANIRFGSSWN